MSTDTSLEIERLTAYIEISNVIGRYQSLHSASRQPEIVELFAKETPGGKIVMGPGVYEGFEGVKKLFLGSIAEAERDLTGRLNIHEVVSPIIEVAGDAQTAKAQISSIGCDTGDNADGTKLSVWCFMKYRFDFVREHGAWVIYNLGTYLTFRTPFEGAGWGEKSDVAAAEFFGGDPANVPPLHSDGIVKVPNKPWSRSSSDSDIHCLVPAPPRPYDTWDPVAEPWVVETA